MIDEAAALFGEFGEGSRVVARRGVFAEVIAGVPWVDMADSRFACDWGSGHIPQPGDTVMVITINDRHLLFPSRALPGIGTVLTVTSGIVTVTTTAGTFSMPHLGTAPTSGELVGISWSEQPYVLGKLSVQPTPVAPPPNPGAGTVRSAVFRAIDTGSHNVGSGNYWQAQPWASDSTFGGWFYGTQIRDTIPASATFEDLAFFVDRRQDQGSAPIFGLHALATKSGQLSLNNLQAWDPPAGWQEPPNAAAWFAALKSGGGRLGVGLNHGGYNKFSSRAQNGNTGAIRISWRS